MPADFSDKSRLLREVAERAQLREGPHGIESVLRAIFRAQHETEGEPLTGRTLARMVRMPVPVVTAVRRELEQAGFVEPGPHIRLTDAAHRALSGPWGWADASQEGNKVTCEVCEGTGVTPRGPHWEAVLGTLRRHFKGNPRVDVTLDQSHCTPETNLRRVAFLQEQGAIAGKDVLVLGDDDSLSAAVALAGKEFSPSGRLARRVVALDTDNRILTHLRDIAVTEGVIIGLVRHDLRKPLPEDLRGEFDTVATDPAYTLPGLTLFLSRAVEAIKPEGGRVFLSFGHRPPDELLAAQRVIADMGLVIERLIPNFNSYVGAGILAGVSDLYVLQVTNETTPLIDGDYSGPLYTGQVRPTVRIYVCTACRSQFAVGGEAGGQFSTIEVLKEKGCPSCGNHSFRLISRKRASGNGSAGAEHDAG